VKFPEKTQEEQLCLGSLGGNICAMLYQRDKGIVNVVPDFTYLGSLGGKTTKRYLLSLHC
jgi:hypothetical protein